MSDKPQTGKVREFTHNKHEDDLCACLPRSIYNTWVQVILKSKAKEIIITEAKNPRMVRNIHKNMYKMKQTVRSKVLHIH